MILGRSIWTTFIVTTAVALSCEVVGTRLRPSVPSDQSGSWLDRHLLAGNDLTPDSYRHFVQRGEQYLVTGEYHLAIEAFEAALQQRFVEVPNFEILVRVAEAKCLAGDKQAGRRLLLDFNCILDLEVGKQMCFLATPDAKGLRNPNLTELCFDRMCSEAFLGYYENPTGETRTRVDRLHEEKLRVSRVCETFWQDSVVPTKPGPELDVQQ